MLSFFIFSYLKKVSVHLSQLIFFKKDKIRNNISNHSCYESMQLILSNICDVNIEDIKVKISDWNLEFEIKCIRDEFKLDSGKKKILLTKKFESIQWIKKYISLEYIFYGTFYHFTIYLSLFCIWILLWICLCFSIFLSSLLF